MPKPKGVMHTKFIVTEIVGLVVDDMVLLAKN